MYLFPVAKKCNFGQILTFDLRDSCTDPPLPMRAKLGVLEQTHGVQLLSNFVSIGSFCRPVAVWRRNPQILPFFGLRQFVVSPIGGSLRQLTWVHNY